MHCEKCGAALEHRSITEHGRILQRHVCTASGCGFIRYGNPVPVVQALVEDDKGNILLARNLEWPSGFFGLISGFLEGREQPSVGMAREMDEEIGVRVDPSDLALVGVATFERFNQIIVLYHIVLPTGTQVTPNLDELAETKWVPLHKLKLRWTEGVGPLVKEWLRGRLNKSKL